MSIVVIDASIALSWCFEDEATPEGDAIFGAVGDEGAIVPILWHLEVCNALIVAERRGRITAGDVVTRLELLDTLPITTDDRLLKHVWGDVLKLARSERLTSYDATYLELSLRSRAALATRDKALSTAAARAGVKLLL